jgi:hypothetical protein
MGYGQVQPEIGPLPNEEMKCNINKLNQARKHGKHYREIFGGHKWLM